MLSKTRPAQGPLLIAVLMLPSLAQAATEKGRSSALSFSPFVDLAERLEERSPEAAATLRDMAAYAGKPQYGAVGVHKGAEPLGEFAYLTRYEHETYSGLHDLLRKTWARMTFENTSGIVVNKGGFVVPRAGHVGWLSVHLLMSESAQGFPRYPHAMNHLDFASVAWTNMKLALPTEADNSPPPQDVLEMNGVGLGEGSWNAVSERHTIWDGKKTVLTRDHGTPLEHAPIFQLLEPHINGSSVPKIRVYEVRSMEIEALVRQRRRHEAPRPTAIQHHFARKAPTHAHGQGATVIPFTRNRSAPAERN